MSRRNYISRSKVKECRECGGAITFTQNKQGKWYPVSVVWDEKAKPYFESGIGAYGNLTPWHKCPGATAGEDARIEQERDELMASYVQRIQDAMDAGNLEEARRLSDEVRRQRVLA